MVLKAKSLIPSKVWDTLYLTLYSFSILWVPPVRQWYSLAHWSAQFVSSFSLIIVMDYFFVDVAVGITLSHNKLFCVLGASSHVVFLYSTVLILDSS